MTDLTPRERRVLERTAVPVLTEQEARLLELYAVHWDYGIVASELGVGRIRARQVASMAMAALGATTIGQAVYLHATGKNAA